VKGIYYRILSFLICFFAQNFVPNGANSSPRLRFGVSPYLRFSASPYRFATTITVCVIISLAVAGCGYHFAGTGGRAPGDIESIAIDVLDNKTAQIGLETVFTNAILNEFIRWKKLPVKPRTQADAVLGGSITRINFREVSHQTRERTFQTRVTITLALNLKRIETDEVLWKRNYSYYDEYVQTGNALDTAVLRREAFNRIAEFLAEKIQQDMFEAF